MTNPQFRKEMGMKRETLLELLAEVEESLVLAAKAKWNYTNIREALVGVRMIMKILKKEGSENK